MKKSEGTTPSERYLSKLCHRSFLSLWSYPNLYTDEGLKGNGVGKELCDLLVIFGNHVIIFSDKYIKFNRDIDTSTAWKRWYKKAILRSANQIYGAESWLRRFPDRIFLDPHCKNPFPISLPDPNSLRVHRVAVALGVHEACAEHFGGNSIGSLCIHSDLIGVEAHLNTPFTIGHINPEKGFIHVFEEFILDEVMREVDTISDFVAYLTKKEQLLCRKAPTINVPGEEQLLAIYLRSLNKAGEHDFCLPIDGCDELTLTEDFWDSFKKNPRYLAKKEADRISYAWDELIEHFINAGTLLSIKEREKALRLMAAEPRVRRRDIAYSLVDLIQNPIEDDSGTRLYFSPDFPDTAYLFLLLKSPAGISYDQYRQTRKAMLLAYCKVAKLKLDAHGRCKNIIGIATDKGGTSEDIVVLNVERWTPEKQQEAESLQKDFSLFLEENLQRSGFHSKEYPDVANIQNAPPQNKKLNRKQRRALATKQRH